MKFNQRLKELRQDRDLTQINLAKEVDSTQRSISNWELGIAEPPYSMLITIADFFQVSVDYLLGITDDPTPPRRIKR